MKIAVVILLFAARVFAAELPSDLARPMKNYDRAQIRNDIATLDGNKRPETCDGLVIQRQVCWGRLPRGRRPHPPSLRGRV